MTDNIHLFSEEYEAQRLQVLADYQILDTPEESAINEIVEVAAIICEVPVARISFVDRDRQWFKSMFGWDLNQTPRED
jgi:hypothetical protein